MLRRPSSIIVVIALAMLVVAITVAPTTAAAGGGCHATVTGARHTEAATADVAMGACSFEPTVAHVPSGTAVRFTNTSTFEHVVTGRGNAWGSDDSMAPGASFERTFTEPGVYPFSCPLHPGMVGAVVVGGSTAGLVGPATTTVASVVATTDDLPLTALAAAGVVGGALVAFLAVAFGAVRRAGRSREIAPGVGSVVPAVRDQRAARD